MVWGEGESGLMHELSPLHRLVAASAGRGVQAAQLLFALDRRLADCWRLTNEPMIAQIRLAWWRDALAGDAASGEPLLASLMALPQFETMRPHLIAMADGWEEWIVRDVAAEQEALLPFAKGRGAGLFRALSEVAGVRTDDRDAGEGAIWALWDLAGQMRDEAQRQAMVELAAKLAVAPMEARRRLAKPAAMLARLYRADVLGGRHAPQGMTPGFYLRIIAAQILAR